MFFMQVRAQSIALKPVIILASQLHKNKGTCALLNGPTITAEISWDT